MYKFPSIVVIMIIFILEQKLIEFLSIDITYQNRKKSFTQYLFEFVIQYVR